MSVSNQKSFKDIQKSDLKSNKNDLGGILRFSKNYHNLPSHVIRITHREKNF